MFPAPINPSIFPVTSVPKYFVFSHLPECVETFAAGICLATDNIIAMVCSAVVIELPKGVFITTIPFAEAADKSTLSTPIPALPITFNLDASAIILAVSLVLDLIANPS